MSGDKVVIIVEGGVVQTVYSENANILATVVDLNVKKVSESYINTFEWLDTQFYEDAIREAISDKVMDFYELRAE